MNDLHSAQDASDTAAAVLGGIIIIVPIMIILAVFLI